ncbi:NEL-type E3 ubiquitin ligase domain-containing protein [Pseudomonas sp. 18175]|uniref:NEL-type E3 ubiquitin ligase domain-containing protein n=1 Tax=Pseudomonas sp. 18175 TaxID=3390056 RepID=UPI003D263A12
MTDTQGLYEVAAPVTRDELDAALLDMTGDMDKVKVLHETLPHWMLDAPSESLAAVEQAYLDSAGPRQRLAQRLARLQPLDSFCTTKLHEYLVGKGHASLNVRQDYLERPRSEAVEIAPNVTGIPIYSTTLEKHSLVQAAMQNFSEDEAEPDGLPKKALIRRGADDSAEPGLTAHQFVGYCRDLDLGNAYQEHLREVFGLPAPGETALPLSYNVAALDVGRGKRADMLTELHLALARQDISQANHARVLKLIKADLPAEKHADSQFTQKRLIWQGLNLDKACLWSVLVFSEAQPGELVDDTLIVYMPNEPERPWYEYATLEAFKQYLTLKLKTSSYREAFARYLDESERVDFLNRFDTSAALGALQAIPVNDNFSDFFFRACVGKVQLDAQVLAVPKAQVDEEARQQRLLDYVNFGLDIFNVAAFVVPVLGQLMMGVAIGQLLGEVFDGVQDWSHGDNAEALKHLSNVAQNLAAMVLFAAGGRVVGSLKRKLASSAEFFDKVEAVKLHDARPRLWRPRLGAYRHSLEIAESAARNSRGVYQVNGGIYIQLAGEWYAIVFDTNIGQWRITHPKRPGAYRPPLRHNFQGGWQHEFERPQEWTEPLSTLHRIDPGLATVPSADLQSIAAINQLDLPALRRLAQAHKALPERFQDAVAKFRQHRTVLDLIQALESGQPLTPATARSQMLALPLMPSWPEGRFFELLDPQGNLLESHPNLAPFDYEDLSVHITEQQLKDGQVMDTLLQALSEEERSTLLGKNVALKDAEALLKQRLLVTVKAEHRALYSKLYDEYNGVVTGDLAPLCVRFPRLPRRFAWEQLSDARTLDRRYLRKNGRLSLTLEQRCREAIEQMDEDEALMGLYWPPLAGAGTRRVIFGLLGRLAHWPQDLLVQVRKGGVTGDVLEQVGPPNASVRRSIVRSDQGFQAFDEQGKDLNTRVSGPDALLQAVVDCLSPAQKKHMGLTVAQPVDRLRSQLRFKSQDERPRIRRYLGTEQPAMEEQLTPCAPAQVQEQAAPVLSNFSTALVRKVRKLYPAMNGAQVLHFLQDAGADHLSRAKAVMALEQEFKALQQALKRWVSDRTDYVPELTPFWDYRLSRTQVREAIERSWRGLTTLRDPEQRSVQSLALDAMAIGKLPTLPAQVRFEQVKQLSLRNMGLNDEAAYFLKHFNNLHTLDLSDNQLTRLPEALSLMPDLTYLYLPRNRLQLTEHTRKKLGELRQLKTLDLADNPLLNAPHVTQLHDLRGLLLRDCGLKEFPVGVGGLHYLERVDLRGNQITTLPDWLLQLPRRAAQAYDLRLNPLSSESVDALEVYLDRVGVGMGFREDDTPRLNEQRARENWLADERVADYAAKSRVWTGLKHEPGSRALFNLLAELVNTADARTVRDDLERRVWRVLNATAAHAALRKEVFERAGAPFNCDDSTAVNFSDLEVLVEIDEVSRESTSGPLAARSRLKVAKGLFRLDQLRQMAGRHSSANPALDPLEVELAFRTGLTSRVYLPGQPQGMLYRDLAGVTLTQLNQAELDIKNAELSPQLLAYIVKLPFWERYLKLAFASRFDTLNAPFNQRADKVYDKREDLSSGEYHGQLNTIRLEREQVEVAEIERLTKDAIRQDDQHVCEAPAG